MAKLETTDAGRVRGDLHLGIVHGTGGIHFVAAARTRAALMTQLASYVRRQADVQLYPEDTTILMRLLKTGAVEAAVRYYFDHVGERWDRETLTETAVAAAGNAHDHRTDLLGSPIP